MLDLCWRDIGDDAINLPDSKTGPRVVPLGEAAQALIKSLPGARDPDASLFPRHAGGRGEWSLTNCWRTVCEDAGLGEPGAGTRPDRGGHRQRHLRRVRGPSPRPADDFREGLRGASKSSGGEGDLGCRSRAFRSLRPVVNREVIHINRRTREVMKVPVGIDPGWDQNVGLVGLDREGLS